MSNSEQKSEYAVLSDEDLKGSPAEASPDDQPASSDQKQDSEEFDYIVPAQRKKHRRRKHRKKKAKNGERSITDESADDFVFVKPRKKHKHHRRHHKKKLPLWLRILIIVVSVILAIAIAVTTTYFILKAVGYDALHNYDDIDISIPIQDDSGKDAAQVLNKGQTIKYGGKTYLLNKDVMAVTFIGFDDSNAKGEGNNMADAIYIAAIDDNTGKTTILGISRDTMLDVDLYTPDGKLIDTEKTQLSYAYSYDNEKVTGGENVNTSLMRLFFGLPFNDYFAIDLDSLEELNDAIGGVTLTSKMEFVSRETGETIHEGDEVTLMGKDVDVYVRSRDLTDLKSNNTRMDRQQQYIKAFLSSIVPAAKKDISTVTNLFDAVNENAATTLDLPKVTYLATAALTKMKNASEIEYVRLSGKIKAGEHAEMYLNDKDVLETMLKIFYIPIE